MAAVKFRLLYRNKVLCQMTPCFFLLVYHHFFFGFVDSVFLSILFTTDKDNFSVIKWNRKWQWNVGVDWTF